MMLLFLLEHERLVDALDGEYLIARLEPHQSDPPEGSLSEIFNCLKVLDGQLVLAVRHL